MWLFLTRRLRTWLIVTLLLPLASGLLRRIGEALQRRNGPGGVSDALLKTSRFGDQARARLRGRSGRR
jgi:formate hydrogenlyase subunit 4